MDTLDELLDSLTAEASATQQQSAAVLDGNANQSESATEPEEPSDTARSPMNTVELETEEVHNSAAQVGGLKISSTCNCYCCMGYSLYVPCERRSQGVTQSEDSCGHKPSCAG